MRTRADAVSRRLQWAAVLTVAGLVVFGTSTAHALWQSRTALTAGTLTAGSFDLSTEWVGAWTAWKPLYPGRASDTATLRVTETAAGGTTLRWRLSASPAVSADLAPYVTTQVYVGACGSGTPLGPTGYSPAGGLSPGQSVDLCLRVTLATTAPPSVQGKAVAPTITVTADQVVS